MHFPDCTLVPHMLLMNQELFNPIMVRRRSYRCNSSYVLFPIVVLSMLTTTTCLNATSDTLSKTESLSDGKTLISVNRTFELGFFSPEASSNRYVGIWYYELPNKTVVWVANRNNPLIDKSGTLRFNDEGDLIVIDGRGSPSIIAHVSGAEGLQAILLDSGNFVLSSLNDSREVLWQSFDYPTDTWLPGMKLGLSGRQNQLLTSWKNEEDPSSGDFSFGADPNGTLQVFIWHETKIYWTSGLWNGEGFRTIPEIQQYHYFNFQFVSNSNEKYYTFSVNDDTVLSRFEIFISGQIKLLRWVENSKEWKLFWEQPRDSCDVYNACGAFGVCSNLSLPYCQCAKGFEPASPTDWDKGNTGGGCQRKTSLQCESGGENDGFLEMTNMKLPPSPQTLLNADRAEECKLACLNNCSCTAYALVKECYLWHGDLVDLQQFGNNSISKVGTICLRLAASEFKFKGGKKKLLSIAIPVSLTALIFCSILCYLWTTRQRHIGAKISSDKLSLFASATTEATNTWWSEQDSQLPLFDFAHIAEATNNFSAENKLGEGGFGPVYKGQTPEGENIAVKRLAVHSGQGLVEFKNEILLIAKLQHRNLVRLLGCCIQGEEKLLVYEYMPNKSLDFFLFDQTRRALLDWGMRFHIIEGIAQGLLYLHKHSRLKIIHRDLKASNILLDTDMNPKISDFGMARIFGSNETQANTNKVVGTYGYISPEYAMEGLFSIKSDVYSFGVLLLEILSGTRNTGFHQHGNFLNLLSYGWELWKEGRWFELMDQSLGEGCPRNEMLRCTHVALMCVQENAADRPTMSEVIAMLSSETTALPDPKQPAFYTVRITAESDAIGKTDGNCSINVVTISAQDGR